MSRRFAITALPMVCVLLVAAPLASAAEDILKLVPESAWGFVVVNQPAAADAKLQALARQVQLPLPSPLTLLKQRFNVREGLDENGTMAMVVLPPEGDAPAPSELLLIPVSDYGKFLQQLQCKFRLQEGFAAGKRDPSAGVPVKNLILLAFVGYFSHADAFAAQFNGLGIAGIQAFQT